MSKIKGVPMRTVHKFELPDWANTISVDETAVPLVVHIQRGKIQLWVEVEKDATATHNLIVNITGTGHPLPRDGSKYLNTFLENDGVFVWHVYTRMEESHVQD